MNAGILPSIALPSLDILIIAGIGVLVAFETLRNGPARPISAVLAFLITVVAYDALRAAAFVSGLVSGIADDIAQALLIAALFATFYVLVRRSIDVYAGSSGFVGAILVAGASTAIIIALWHAFAPLMALWDFNAGVNEIFGAAYRFWWILVGLATLAFATG